MSARAGQWELLDHESDPVPGTPSDVLEQGQYYTLVADTIEEQIGRLRRLAEPDEALVGHYAEELTGACSDLADHLDKIGGRFRTTGSELQAFEADIEIARTGTWRALQDAEAADQQRRANQPIDRPPGAEEPTQAEQDAADDRAGRHSAAAGDLATAKSDASGVMSTFDDRAEQVANRIREASDDDMKDSGWDKFKSAVSSIAGPLKLVAKILGYIALALTVIALVLVLTVGMAIPGLNLILAGLLLGSLAINTLLAATDNGSWTAVAWDVAGLATLGLGAGALRVARAGRAVTLTRAARPAAQAARTTAFRTAAWNGGRGVSGFVSRFRPSVIAVRSAAYSDEVARVTSRAMPTRLTVPGLLRGGGSRGAGLMADDLARIVQDYPAVNVAIRHTAGINVARSVSAASWAKTGVITTPRIVEDGDWVAGRIRTAVGGD